MGQRKVTILDPATEEVARIALFIEGKGLPETAKKFVDKAFEFFDNLSDERVLHHPCKHLPWNLLHYRCAHFRKKYVVAYLDNTDEIIICDFALQKLLGSTHK
jgi:plasmid stabilization system protein ParE